MIVGKRVYRVFAQYFTMNANGICVVFRSKEIVGVDITDMTIVRACECDAWNPE
jgi:hypothetical protein